MEEYTHSTPEQKQEAVGKLEQMVNWPANGMQWNTAHLKNAVSL